MKCNADDLMKHPKIYTFVLLILVHIGIPSLIYVAVKLMTYIVMCYDEGLTIKNGLISCLMIVSIALIIIFIIAEFFMIIYSFHIIFNPTSDIISNRIISHNKLYASLNNEKDAYFNVHTLEVVLPYMMLSAKVDDDSLINGKCNNILMLDNIKHWSNSNYRPIDSYFIEDLSVSDKRILRQNIENAKLSTQSMYQYLNELLNIKRIEFEAKMIDIESKPLQSIDKREYILNEIERSKERLLNNT